LENADIMVVVVSVNAVLAAGFGWPLARTMANLRGSATWRWVAGLLGVYLAECFAFSASMASNVLSFGLAVVWGFVFARWTTVRGGTTGIRRDDRRRVVERLAAYTCLPAVSFLAVFPFLMLSGWPVFTRRGGYDFGIPEFVPWPFCTIAGFFVAVVGSAVIVKMLVTMAIAMWWTKRHGQGI